MEKDTPKNASGSFEKVFFTLEEAAELLTVAPSTLRGMVREQQIPYSRIRKRRIVFEKDDLLDFVRKNKIQPKEKQQLPRLDLHQVIRGK